MVRPGQRLAARWPAAAPAFKHGRRGGDRRDRSAACAAVAPEVRAASPSWSTASNWATSVTGTHQRLVRRPATGRCASGRGFSRRRGASRRRGLRHRRDRAARAVRRRRSGRGRARCASSSSRASVVGVLAAKGQAGDGQRPGRHRRAAAAHGAAPRRRQPARQHDAGVDAATAATPTSVKASRRASCCASAASSPTATDDNFNVRDMHADRRHA